MKDKNDFEITYSAPTKEERKEIESIRNGYITPNNASKKLAYLRKMNNIVQNVPTAVSLAVGIIGLLIFGLGFAMILEWNLLIAGVVVSAVGLIPILLAYPIYNKSLNYLKNKYSEEIIRISDELLNEHDSKKE